MFHDSPIAHSPEPSATSIERLREVCAGGVGSRAPRLAFGCDAIDRKLAPGGLLIGAVHELLGISTGSESRRFWTPPLSVALHLAQRAGAAMPEGSLLWIGERAWPFPTPLFAPGEELGRRSIFVRARRAEERVWATDLSLRSGAAAAVLTDGTGMDLSSSRRLQLAAEAGGCMCLMLRPPWEREELSAAATRWSVRAAPAESGSIPARRWIVELLRCKGVQPAGAAPHPRRWILERNHATRHGLVAAELLDRPGEKEAVPARRWG